MNEKHEKYYKIIDNLNKKDCFITKADKGNSVVILNKQDYYEGVEKLIQEGPFVKVIKHPVKKTFCSSYTRRFKNGFLEQQILV